MKTYLSKIRTLAAISTPLFISRIGVPIRGIIVTFLLATLGLDSLSAGALVYSLTMVVLTFAFGIMSSVGAKVAYATGQGNNTAVTNNIQQGIWLGILVSAPFILLFQNIDIFFYCIGQDQ